MFSGRRDKESMFVLAGAAAVLLRRRLPKTGVFVVWHDISIRAFMHFVTDDVHQALENLLYVDVVFGAGLEELESWNERQEKMNEVIKETINTSSGSSHRDHLPASDRPRSVRVSRLRGHICCPPERPVRYPTSTSWFGWPWQQCTRNVQWS